MSTPDQRHPTLPANTLGRDFVVADLHGHRRRLDQALEEHHFDPSQDRLLSVGDLIDRGPDSPGCLDLLNEPWFWAVRGNHEQMMVDAVTTDEAQAWSRWLMNGGNWALEQPEHELSRWARQIDTLPMTLTIKHPLGTVGLCHAQYRLPHWNDRLRDSEMDVQDWLWGRSRVYRAEPAAIQGVDWVFHGHTIIPRVTALGNAVFLDRGAFTGGPLVVLCLDEWMNNPSTRRINDAID